MTVASINDEVNSALLEYRQINGQHWIESTRLNAFNETVPTLKYHVLTSNDEKRCVQVAERIARLYKFLSHLTANKYSSP